MKFWVLTYIENRLGYDVLHLRGGKSRGFFSVNAKQVIKEIAIIKEGLMDIRLGFIKDDRWKTFTKKYTKKLFGYPRTQTKYGLTIQTRGYLVEIESFERIKGFSDILDYILIRHKKSVKRQNWEELIMSEIDGYIEWTKEKPSDKVWWGTIFHGISEDDIKSGRATDDDINDSIGLGDHIFSFDKHKIYWLFRDYPDALTNEEKETFDKENPYWKNFFKDR